MSRDAFQMPWAEVHYTYDPALRDGYYAGMLFSQWRERYKGHLLFCSYMNGSHQIPHSCRIPRPQGFGELLMGMRYIDAGYDASWCYRDNEDTIAHQLLCELAGGSEAARIIAPNGEPGGRPPDLLVVHRETGRFRFVEIKRPGERLTATQPTKFPAIEALLNRNCDRSRRLLTDPSQPILLPPLAEGQWIHIVRLAPAMSTLRTASVGKRARTEVAHQTPVAIDRHRQEEEQFFTALGNESVPSAYRQFGADLRALRERYGDTLSFKGGRGDKPTLLLRANNAGLLAFSTDGTLAFHRSSFPAALGQQAAAFYLTGLEQLFPSEFRAKSVYPGVRLTPQSAQSLLPRLLSLLEQSFHDR
jgi:hypothetical protein